MKIYKKMMHSCMGTIVVGNLMNLMKTDYYFRHFFFFIYIIGSRRVIDKKLVSTPFNSLPAGLAYSSLRDSNISSCGIAKSNKIIFTAHTRANIPLYESTSLYTYMKC